MRHLHIGAHSAEIIPGQIHEHYMLGIFFGVLCQFISPLLIFHIIACAFKSAGNRVNDRFAAFDDQLRLGRRADQFIVAVIEEKQVRRWIDIAQGTIYVNSSPVKGIWKRLLNTI
jgi:hypothetical protein